MNTEIDDSIVLDAMRYRWLRHGDNDEKVLKTYTSRPSKPGEPTMFLPRNGELDRLIDAARTVMLDQVSFDRKPDCYGIRQITDDDGVEEWVDIRTSPDVAREEANDMMATGRGEIYEVVPLWTTPQPTQPQARRDALEEAAAAVEKATPTPQADGQPAPDEIINMAREQGLPETEIEGVFRVNADDLCRVAAAILAARAPADSVLEDAARLDWLLLHISRAEFRRIGVHYSGNAGRADVDAARKKGENHD